MSNEPSIDKALHWLANWSMPTTSSAVHDLARMFDEERLKALEDAVKVVEAMTLGFPTVMSVETVKAIRQLEREK